MALNKQILLVKKKFKKAKDERRIIADREYAYIEGGEIEVKVIYAE